jgi:flagellar protein FlaJ
MIRLINRLCNEIESFLSEIQTYSFYRNELNENLEILDKQYQRGDFNYKKYISHRNKLLYNNSKKESIQYYDSYINDLLNKLDFLNTKLLTIVYKDKSYRNLKINKKIVLREFKKFKKLPVVNKLKMFAPDLEINKSDLKFPLQEEFELKTPESLESIKPKTLANKDKIRIPFDVPVPEPEKIIAIPEPKKISPVKSMAYKFQSKTKPFFEQFSNKDNVKLMDIFNFKFLKYLMDKNRGEVISEDTKILPSIFDYEKQDIGSVDKVEEEIKGVLDPYLLEKEIKEIKNLISTKKTKVYEPSSLGYLANITVRRMSIFFIEKFPPPFRKLYRAIRLANMKILSNTYINIMFFLSILFFFISIPVFAIIFSLNKSLSFLIVLKTIFFSFLVSLIVFVLAFYYPFTRIKKRRISINTNLPFAIDHMSSVIGSGVPPTTMFKLLSASKEYGEISVEMEKISNYIEVFGYDVLTAIRSVSVQTPSSEFKEFLDGLVSTVETGGKLREYLKQKSQEAMLHYRLERQKYIESISTYSDIYTGVLIAAPLFFVTALSLVSMLGGKVGGVDINVIITVGTYLVIPVLNIIFIIFLEINQPEI